MSVFDVSAVSGSGEDIFTFQATSLGGSTAGTYDSELRLDGSQTGLADPTSEVRINGMQVSSEVFSGDPLHGGDRTSDRTTSLENAPLSQQTLQQVA